MSSGISGISPSQSDGSPSPATASALSCILLRRNECAMPLGTSFLSASSSSSPFTERRDGAPASAPPFRTASFFLTAGMLGEIQRQFRRAAFDQFRNRSEGSVQRANLFAIDDDGQRAVV